MFKRNLSALKRASILSSFFDSPFFELIAAQASSFLSTITPVAQILLAQLNHEATFTFNCCAFSVLISSSRIVSVSITILLFILSSSNLQLSIRLSSSSSPSSSRSQTWSIHWKRIEDLELASNQ